MSFVGDLRGYQARGVAACVERGQMLIAYPMGSGKTPVAIAVIEALNDEWDDTLSGLVFANSALRYQWDAELAKFTGGSMNAKGSWSGGASRIIVDGTQEKRIAAYKRIIAEHPQYVILGYEQAVADYQWVRRLPRDFVVMDEVSMLKGAASQRTQAVSSLDAPFRFGLSGTPMENGKPDELFSIMSCIDPTVFGRADLFDRTFVNRNRNGWIVGYRNIPQMHRTLSSAMIRVSRDDPEVAQYMPQRNPPRTHYVTLDDATADIYRVIVDDLITELANALRTKSFDVMALYAGVGGGDEVQGRIAAKITAARMLLTHPEILRESAMKWRATEKTGSRYASDLLDSGVLDTLPKSGAKFNATVDRLDHVLDRDPENKIVVFSFFKGALARLADFYSNECVQFHGGMNAKAKAAAKQQFQHDPKTKIFLSSDAGGYGVDLPQANWLLNVDLPYSKGKMDQRNSRHDRAGSHHEVIHTETFLVEGSIETFYAGKLTTKGSIARAIIDGRGYDRQGRMELGASTLLEFLENSDV